MGSSTVDAAARAKRERLVEEAIHTGAMEGLQVTPATRADAQAYIEGRIDSDELVARIRARYRPG
ncbi:antitoxin VbhA family protein [Arthrobacter sp. ATA002]|uniref:antitoxin VbhA family protein n=1 Tax=Arthrobacter sp. ATA002 TaxID=2991715 RepID=UPI0022A66126|nr:antitoxin VbhA family protein [Arthrobacter sp. ATA002]WAP50582.1 antitoxin VbhA family protein [Arthrobacter sp. ATA002]